MYSPMVWECVLTNKLAALHVKFILSSSSFLAMTVLLLKQQKVPYLFYKLTTAGTKFITLIRNKK